MSGFKVIAALPPWSSRFIYGDARGGHVRVFVGWGQYEAMYYGGDGLGVLLGCSGYGQTPDEAVRNLWGKL